MTRLIASFVLVGCLVGAMLSATPKADATPPQIDLLGMSWDEAMEVMAGGTGTIPDCLCLDLDNSCACPVLCWENTQANWDWLVLATLACGSVDCSPAWIEVDPLGEEKCLFSCASLAVALANPIIVPCNTIDADCEVPETVRYPVAECIITD